MPDIAPTVVAAAAAPCVRIEGVSKRFGDFLALDQVSLDIQRQELFCLLGGSGCGKTTLLRLLAGFDEPSAGRIFIDGVDMRGVPPYARPVNMMFQSYALFPHMTVFDNVAFGLRQEGLARAAIRARVEAMLDLVKLGPLIQRRPQQLSGGQKQRVALARALIKRPLLLLLDEPLAALDQQLREATQFELMNIQATLGVTFVIVTHDQHEAMTLANRIGVMDRGRLLQIGTPEAIYRTPDTRFVAEFIGSVNLFAGHGHTTGAGRLALTCPAAGATLQIASARTCADGTPLWLAVRPEQMALAMSPPAADADNCLRGTITGGAYLGGHSLIKVGLAGGMEIKVTVPAQSLSATPALGRGQTVWLAWPATSGVVVSE